MRHLRTSYCVLGTLIFNFVEQTANRFIKVIIDGFINSENNLFVYLVAAQNNSMKFILEEKAA